MKSFKDKTAHKTLLTLFFPFSLFILMNPHNLSLQTKLHGHLGSTFSGKHHRSSHFRGKVKVIFTPNITGAVVFSTKVNPQMTT